MKERRVVVRKVGRTSRGMPREEKFSNREGMGQQFQIL